MVTVSLGATSLGDALILTDGDAVLSAPMLVPVATIISDITTSPATAVTIQPEMRGRTDFTAFPAVEGQSYGSYLDNGRL